MKPHPSASSGGDATWAAQPATGDWNTAANWTPAAVPKGTATFGTSSQSGITFQAGSSATVDAIVFASGAAGYTFTFNAPAPNAPALTISGAGVTNNSATSQRVVVASSAQNYHQAQLVFTNAASAGGSNMLYSAGPATPDAAGGGVIGFYGTSTAGAASFVITTGAGTPPKTNSTVGGEVGFSDSSNAGTAQFNVYGSTSTTDGDTFGNAVFHDKSSAAAAVFTNQGGTVNGGDGGNTQFYNNATAANGLFHNMGGTVKGANGGDVAFDGTSTAATGHFHNYAATASGGYGGVTSFNNNAPSMPENTQAASAGNGLFYNYGAKASGQGGGHTFFTGKYGSATGANGTFVNYGGNVAGTGSTAGHTVFSISLPAKYGEYCPDAGEGVFWNFPGMVAGAAGGYTEFTVYADPGTPITGSKGPTAGNATCMNLGAVIAGAQGGQTQFGGTADAANAQLIATGGVNGGQGGAIVFSSVSSGGSAAVNLAGNGTLDISGHSAPGVSIKDLDLWGGVIVVSLGTNTTCLAVSGTLGILGGPVAFGFKAGSGFAPNTTYTILTASNLSSFGANQFMGNAVNGAAPTFTIVGNALEVTFGGGGKAVGR